MNRQPATIRIVEIVMYIGLYVAAAAALIAVIAVFGADGAGTRHVRVNPYATATPTPVPAPAGTVTLREPTSDATLTIAEPSHWQRFLLILPELLLIPVLCAVAVYLLLMMRSFRQGDPFTPVNAVRLGSIGLLLMSIAAIPMVDAWILRLLVSGTPLEGTSITSAVDYRWAPIVGLGVLALAEFFRQGTRLRSDLQGLV